jgi:hypothetical protein
MLSLRLSAVLGVLCVREAFDAENRRETQRTAERRREPQRDAEGRRETQRAAEDRRENC